MPAEKIVIVKQATGGAKLVSYLAFAQPHLAALMVCGALIGTAFGLFCWSRKGEGSGESL